MFEELDDYRNKIREFALKEFTEDIAAEYDRKEAYPDELRKKSLSLGIVDMQNPAKVLIAIEELCRVLPSVPASLAPVAPSGWPMDIPPPCMFTFSRSRLNACTAFRTTTAKASLISQ